MPAGWISAGAAVIGAVGSMDAQDSRSSRDSSSQQVQDIIAIQQQQMAQQQWQRYLNTYAPLEDEYASEAKNVGSVANQNAAAAKAAAATSSAYATARERLAKNPGMNQSEQAYLQEANRISLGEAAASATNQNTARDKVIDTGNARMTDAVSIGKGMPAQATSSLSSASATGNALLNSRMAASRDEYLSDMNGIGQFGKAAGGLFQSKSFQNWFNNSGTNSLGNSTSAASWDTPATSYAFGTGGMGD